MANKATTTKISLSTINKVMAYSAQRTQLQTTRELIEGAKLHNAPAGQGVSRAPARGTASKTGNSLYMTVQVTAKAGNPSGYRVGDAYSHMFYFDQQLMLEAIDALIEKQAGELEELGISVDE